MRHKDKFMKVLGSSNNLQGKRQERMRALNEVQNARAAMREQIALDDLFSERMAQQEQEAGSAWLAQLFNANDESDYVYCLENPEAGKVRCSK